MPACITPAINHGVAWDASRPVPYRRLLKEWLIYAAIMAVVFVLVLRDSTSTFGLVFGLAISLPLYVGLSYVLAKFGYQRKTLAELRTPRAAGSDESGGPSGSTATTTGRTRPAPTRRTAAGSTRPKNGRPPRKRR